MSWLALLGAIVAVAVIVVERRSYRSTIRRRRVM
jgi:hypothetical protein